ncbi:translation initiation factor IF-2, mitochondrial isoform X2 [Hyposmocoma kahamanoa]|uniref:translation initiation factor IF-2, mitochondrial isoform X2 n=1 Tax=Hyposmocoma kahamanoa TaxID=1477025 RepID=UPI000E6D9187|nr:translation initiation factor IF-2, mitochondrial isoform X2 [Hyposmocoma kahamanoa]
MFKSLLFRWFPLRSIQKESVQQLAELKQSPFHICQRHKPFSASVVCYKKRKSIEERAVENQGRKVFRYSKANSDVVGIWRNMTVREIAQVLNKDVDHVFRALEFADKNSDSQYKEDTVVHNPQVIRDVVKISGCRFKIVPPPDKALETEESQDAAPAPPAPRSALRPRPPVVCVMGHVDHGKTTLLDALRGTSEAARERGGITQHIGAFDVPVLVAVTKTDKPGADVERALRELARHGLVCEALGGDVQAVPVSALRRTNLDALLEALTLQAQLMELKADPGGPVEGVVLEARLDSRAGKQATVLVQRGTLRRGCVLVAGSGWGKVRMLKNSEGRTIQEAPPSTPVSVQGWRELPSAGDQVLEVASEKRANEVMKWRHNQRMKEKQAQDLTMIEAKEAEHRQQYKAQLAKKRAMGRFRLRPDGPRQKMIQEDTHPTLSLVIKGDVDGSVEAILDILETYDEHDTVRLDLVHYGVGPVTPNDIEVAEAFGATVLLFNADCAPELALDARRRGVPVRRHDVIYRLVDDVRDEISARMPLAREEEALGEAKVLQRFTVTEGKRKVPVAGARCVKGALHRDARFRLLRDGRVVHEGPLASMKHLKAEVATVPSGTECGLRLADAAVELRAGDTLQCFRLRDARRATRWDPGF